MKMIEQMRGLNPLRYRKQLLYLAACAAVVVLVVRGASTDSDEYLSASPAITQRFTGIMSEQMLLDFCYHVQGLQGITGVSYRDYSAAQRTAMVTVYYNPRKTTQRQIKIFLEYANMLWVVPKAT